MKSIKNPLIVICGPTATGKSALAVEIAMHFGGEIISADSRQVYRGLDIGSAKITEGEMQGVLHHLLSIADPKEVFTVAEFQTLARKAISDIQSRGRIPILCGGTGLYISSVIDGTSFPHVAPNVTLRSELDALSTEALFSRLVEIDLRRAETIDRHNKIRLIRAIEIASTPQSAAHAAASSPYKGEPLSVLQIGLTLPKEELLERIQKRIEDRIPALFDEIRTLNNQGVSWKRLESFGLEYRYGADYVQKKISLDQFKETLTTKTWQYVRRQMTWFKRDARIHWMNPVTDTQKILDLVENFLTD